MDGLSKSIELHIINLLEELLNYLQDCSAAFYNYVHYFAYFEIELTLQLRTKLAIFAHYKPNIMCNL